MVMGPFRRDEDSEKFVLPPAAMRHEQPILLPVKASHLTPSTPDMSTVEHPSGQVPFNTTPSVTWEVGGRPNLVAGNEREFVLDYVG
jgi:hypothetical protein